MLEIENEQMRKKRKEDDSAELQKVKEICKWCKFGQ